MQQAPQAALDYLQANPDTAHFFKDKYGYLPAPTKALEYLEANPDTAHFFQEKYGYLPEQKEEGFIDKAKDLFTGESRETRATRDFEEYQNSGILADQDPATLAKIAPVLLATTDPIEVAQIIQKNFPDIRMQGDEKGNVLLANNKTGNRAVVNKPGMSQIDLINALGLSSAFIGGGGAGGLLSNIAKQGAKDAAVAAGIEGAQEATGGEFNPADVAIAGGIGAGLRGVEDLAGTAYRSIKGDVAPEQQQLLQAAQDANIPLRTTDVLPPETFIGRQAENLGDQLPVLGTAGKRATQQQLREDAVEDYIGNFGQPSNELIIRSVKEKKDKITQNAVDTRNAIVDQVSMDEVTTANAIDAIDREIKRLTTSPTGQAKTEIDTPTVTRLENIRTDIINDPTFKNLEEIRTDFRDIIRGDTAVKSNRKEGAIKNIYSAMTKDLDNTIKDNLGPRDLARWKKSNAIYGREAEQLKNTRIKQLFQKGELTPELVENQLFSRKPSDIRRLFSSLGQEGRDNARAAIISRAERIAKGGGSEPLSVNKFLKQLQKDQAATDVFFSGRAKKELEGLKNVLRATRGAQDANFVSKSGMQTIPYLLGGGIVADLAKTLFALISVGGTSKIYQSKLARNTLLKLANTKKGSTEFEQAARRLNDIILPIVQSSQQGGTEQNQQVL